MNNAIHVLIGTNDKYLPGAVVTILSIIMANDMKNNFVFHVMDTGISPQNKIQLCSFFGKYTSVKIDIKKIDVDYFKQSGAPEGPGGGYSAYARLLMTEFIEGDRCIYIDSDFFVRLDFNDLWTLSMDDYGIAACLDTSKTGETDYNKLSWDCPFEPKEKVEHYGYYNSGLLVCNLAYWRKFEFKEKMQNLIEGYSSALKHHDQTIINYLFRGRIKQLPEKWNLPPWWTRPLDNISNMHFTADKPWTLRTYLPAERIWFIFYDALIKPHWNVITISRQKTKGLYKFLRYWGVPALFAESYGILLNVFSKRDLTSQRNRLVVLKKIRQTLLIGLDSKSQLVLDNFRSSLPKN